MMRLVSSKQLQNDIRIRQLAKALGLMWGFLRAYDSDIRSFKRRNKDETVIIDAHQPCETD